ncbi:FAD-dependent oxidoreductase [Kocuria sp. cx-455]|uniref:FAD-dependent oxidoreductase n=1 Tax=Kocuria sp. cx-455 TaxID=2771377 RepID=UPI003D71DC36
MRVAVIGAGVAGLSTAVGLQRAGAHVTVLERSGQLRPGGSGLSIFGNGRAALDALGLTREFDALTSETAGLLLGGMRKPNGAWIKVFPAETVRDVRVIHREELHNLLSSQLEPGVVRLGTTISELTVTGDLRGRTAHGAAFHETFDLIVGADGLRSTLRTLWPKDPGIRYAGYGAWRGVTSHPVDLHGEAGETWGRHQRFGIVPLPDGRVYWFAVDSRPAEATGPGVPETHGAQREVLERFGSWHAPIPELVDATSSAAIQWLPIHELGAPLPSVRYGRAVLVGDAAHAMTPNLGQGGNQALEDSATLAVLLRTLARQDSPRPLDIDAALAEYDRLRRPRTRRIARRSRLIGDAANLQGRGTSMVRDLALQLTPTSALRRQFSTIHDWAPPP